MRDHFVIDPLIGKREQLLLATQLCRLVLKVPTIHFQGLLFPFAAPTTIHLTRS